MIARAEDELGEPEGAPAWGELPVGAAGGGPEGPGWAPTTEDGGVIPPACSPVAAGLASVEATEPPVVIGVAEGAYWPGTPPAAANDCAFIWPMPPWADEAPWPWKPLD
jgi:hypothetical protein